MRRLLLVTSVLCAIDTTQAFAQHEVSQQLLELEEADRNIFFTMLLRGSNKRCDQVIRTLFNACVGSTGRRNTCVTLTKRSPNRFQESRLPAMPKLRFLGRS